MLDHSGNLTKNCDDIFVDPDLYLKLTPRPEVVKRLLIKYGYVTSAYVFPEINVFSEVKLYN